MKNSSEASRVFCRWFTFLFNVVADPMERASLRDRQRDISGRMVSAWNAWDAGMLPEVRESFTEQFTAATLADHIGAKQVNLDPDPSSNWPAIVPPKPE